MSARKISNTQLFEPPSLESHTRRLDLPAHAVRIRKNGIEFKAEVAIEPWTEMTVALEALGDAKKVNFSGVVVACIRCVRAAGRGGVAGIAFGGPAA